MFLIFIVLNYLVCRARIGSLTFAKHWIVRWAKGNVPIVCRHTFPLSAGRQKKTKSFFFNCISIFHSQTIISVTFVVAVFFFALLVTIWLCVVRDFIVLNFQPT